MARSIELVHAFDEAIAIVEDYHREPDPSRIAYEPAAGSGCHATEAPRGLLYHRYRIGEDGLIAEAKIVPPTSQNLRRIEDDLRAYVPRVTGFDDAEAARRCEHLIRNFDPCISCATHFLKMKVDRGSPMPGAIRQGASRSETLNPETDNAPDRQSRVHHDGRQ